MGRAEIRLLSTTVRRKFAICGGSPRPSARVVNSFLRESEETAGSINTSRNSAEVSRCLAKEPRKLSTDCRAVESATAESRAFA